MQPSVPPDPPATVDAAELARLKARSRRLTAVSGLALAVAIVAAALYVGDYQGFDQIGRGGVNAAYLPKVGEPAPDFTVALTDGSLVRLSDFRGRPVWLNFWGSWCPPCRAEMPEMQAAYQELAPRGLVILAVSLDEPTKNAAEFAALNRVTYLVASDPRRLATGADYRIANFPTHILIDADGIVRDIVLAPIDREEIVVRAETILSPRP